MIRFGWLVICSFCVSVGCGNSGGNGGGGDGGMPDGTGGSGGGTGGGGVPPISAMEPELLAAGNLNAVWGTSGDDLYAVGGNGLIAHYDGESWRPMELPAAADLTNAVEDILGFADDDIYATMSRTILHYDGVAWTIVEDDDLDNRSFGDIWGSSPSDVYVTAGADLVHFDGGDWTVVAPGVSGARWFDISGSGPDDIVVVGRIGAFEETLPAFAHFDGDGWTEHTPPDPPVVGSFGAADLLGVHSASSTAALAIGRFGYFVFWNGSGLTKLDNGPLDASQNGSVVWATSPNEFYVAWGEQIWRYNGSNFTEVAPAAPIVDNRGFIRQVTGFAGNDFYAVGPGVHHFDGAAWDSPLSGLYGPRRLWASSPSNVLLAGLQPLRYDGAIASPEDFGALGAPSGGLTAAWGPADRLVAAGDDGSMLVYNGSTWALMTSNNEQSIQQIWGSSNDDVYAVGRQGTIIHFNGTAWGNMGSGTEETLRGVWGSGPDNIFASGTEGTIVRYDGGTWSPMESGTDSFLRDVLGFDQSTILIGYEEGFLLGDGVSWTPMPVEIGDRPPASVHAFDGVADDDLFLSVGAYSEEFEDFIATFGHDDGTTWTPLLNLGGDFGVDVVVVGPREVFVASGDAFYRFAVPD